MRTATGRICPGCQMPRAGKSSREPVFDLPRAELDAAAARLGLSAEWMTSDGGDLLACPVVAFRPAAGGTTVGHFVFGTNAYRAGPRVGVSADWRAALALVAAELPAAPAAA